MGTFTYSDETNGKSTTQSPIVNLSKQLTNHKLHWHWCYFECEHMLFLILRVWLAGSESEHIFSDLDFLFWLSGSFSGAMGLPSTSVCDPSRTFKIPSYGNFNWTHLACSWLTVIFFRNARLHSIQFIITKLLTDYLQIVYVELIDEVFCPRVLACWPPCPIPLVLSLFCVLVLILPRDPYLLTLVQVMRRW